MLTGDAKEAFRREHEEHWRRKEEAQDVKSADKERAIEEEGFVSATFDLESVLQIPSSPVSVMYYSRKLCVYNLCVYHAAPPNKGFCYCWPEIEGGKGSNVCTTGYLSYHLPLKKCRCFQIHAEDKTGTRMLQPCSSMLYTNCP
jgi:hypothetical protein